MLTAWITESGRDCLQQGDGPVRAVPEQCEETGFTVLLVEADQLGLVPERDALAEQLACVRQALPEHWRDSVPSVAVATLAADNALLKATEQRLRKLLEGADRRAVAHGKELIELAARAANVAGERAANALLTAELEQRQRPLTEYEVDRLWLQRVDQHDGELLPQLRDFARAIERAHSIKAEGKDS